MPLNATHGYTINMTVNAEQLSDWSDRLSGALSSQREVATQDDFVLC